MRDYKDGFLYALGTATVQSVVALTFIGVVFILILMLN